MADIQTRAAGTLFQCGNKVLLLKRSHERIAPHMWDLPGGHMETGESPKETARREFEEECGLPYPDAKMKKLDEVNWRKVGTVHYITFLTKVDVEFRPKLNKEHRKFKWFDLNDLPYHLHPGLAITLAKIGGTHKYKIPL